VVEFIKYYYQKVSISHSFFIYLFSSILNLLVSYGLLVLLLRTLPKDQYGQYGLYISLFSILLIFFNFGHKEAIFKFSSQSFIATANQQFDRTLRSYFLWNFFLLVVLQGLLLVDIIVYVVAMVFLLNSWLITAAAYYRGQANYKQDAYALPLQRTLWLLICLIVYYFIEHFTLLAVFLSALAATILSLFWLLFPLNKHFRIAIKAKAKVKANNKHIMLLINFFVIELASVFYLKSDILLLRFYHLKLSSIADYFFAIQLFEIMVLVIMPIGYFYFNDLSKQDNTLNINDKKIKLKNYLPPMVLIVAFAHIIIFFLAPIVFPILIPKYTASITTVLFMMFSLYPVVLNILLSSKLIVENKETVYARICFFALIFNVLSNIMLIPYFELNGVLFTKFMTELFISLMLLKTLYSKGDRE